MASTLSPHKPRLACRDVPSAVAEQDRLALAALSRAVASLGVLTARHDNTEAATAGLVRLSRTCVPMAQHAAIVAARGDVMVRATTSRIPCELTVLEQEIGAGPVGDVLRRGAVVNATELGNERRWRPFGRRALDATGIQSLLGLAVQVGEDRYALMLYSDWPFAFDDTAVCFGTILVGAYALSRSGG